MLGPNGKPIEPDNDKLKPEGQPGSIPEQKLPEQMELIIVWKDQGIGVAGNCVKNEMISLYMLEKAKKIIEKLNAPQIIPAHIGLKGNMINFARKIMGRR